MKFPLVSGFCIASVIFAGCTYMAYTGTLWATYRYRESRAFRALGKDDPQLPAVIRTLDALGTSHLFTGHESSRPLYRSAVDKNIPFLQQLRKRAPQELWPPIDLQMATDYAELARLQQAENPAEADKSRRSAEDILRSLGWTQLSHDVLDALADRELQPAELEKKK